MKVSEPARITYAFLIAPLFLTLIGVFLRMDSYQHDSFRNYLGWVSLTAYGFSWPPLLLAFLIFKRLGLETIKNYTISGCVVGSFIFLVIGVSSGENLFVMMILGALFAGSISFLFGLIRGARWNSTPTRS